MVTQESKVTLVYHIDHNTMTDSYVLQAEYSRDSPIFHAGMEARLPRHYDSREEADAVRQDEIADAPRWGMLGRAGRG
jgi:hypothetical protein